MIVRELIELLQTLPQDVTVMMPDSQNGDREVDNAVDTKDYAGGRVVRLEI